MKFTKLNSSIYMRNILPDCYLGLSPYAIVITWVKKGNIMKKEIYSDRILVNDNYWLGKISGSYCKAEIYDIIEQEHNINEAYIYNYVGRLYKDSGKYFIEKNTKNSFDNYLYFKENIYFYNNEKNQYDNKQLCLLLKEFVYKEDTKFLKLSKEINLFEKMKKSEQEIRKREQISEEVKFEVWRRDEGKCVMCGSKENLEFDHIIPFSKGGSNTTRNLQLLCETCNRQKGAKI